MVVLSYISYIVKQEVPNVKVVLSYIYYIGT